MSTIFLLSFFLFTSLLAYASRRAGHLWAPTTRRANFVKKLWFFPLVVIGLWIIPVILFTDTIIPDRINNWIRGIWFLSWMFYSLVGIVLLLARIWHLLRHGRNVQPSEGRRRFLAITATGIGSVPVLTMMSGLSNAYRYQYRKAEIPLNSWPESLDGFRIVHISDIHTGSFTKKEPLVEAVKQINAMKADLIVFTGDLVNDTADEVEEYIPIFTKLRAKHGVYSILGNHDYGDYRPWDSKTAKQENLEKLYQAHGRLGWNLLLNDHAVIEVSGAQFAILGVHYWGNLGRFEEQPNDTDRGDIKKAKASLPEDMIKILLSHDPSHFDAEVLDHKDIELTLSGHTHGAQFGVENRWLRWSPSQYFYPKWAGLYQVKDQFLYVNRGFGFLGYPGRVGILPEVTELILRKKV
ncbi:MAG: metallophosphoesterase [Bacteroidota bacterium]|nr:metallophosphoesterase [Bacteroidota bacterium]